MKPPSTRPEIRSRAEKWLADRIEKKVELPEDQSKLIQELRVHQIELEMQNQELVEREADLQEASQKYSDLYNNAPVGYITLDAEGNITEANTLATHLLGFQQQELRGRKFAAYIAAKSQDTWYKHRHQVINMPGKRNCVLEMHNRKGGSFVAQIESLSIHDCEAGRKHCHVVMVDITERQRADNLIRLQHAAIQSAANAVMVTDAQGKIISINPAFTTMTGYSEVEIIGKSPAMFNSGEHPREFFATMWSRILGGQIWHGELRNKRRDGSLYDEEMTISPVRDDLGRIAHFIAIKQEVTEKKRLLREAMRTQRIDSLGMIAAGMAHNLNNLLHSARMCLDGLESKSLTKTQERPWEILKSTVDRSSQIVSQVLTFARGVEVNPCVLDTRDLVHEIHTLSEQTFPKNIKVASRIAEDLRPIKGDATQLQQVLLNLCVNARDAMPEGGELWIDARNQLLDYQTAHLISHGRPGVFAAITISDTGAGMSQEVVEHLFEPFFTTKGEGKGTGLGLATVYGIVRSHSGFIRVISQPGKGSTFTLFLPVTEEKPAKIAPPHVEPPPRGKGELILLVDDEPFVRDLAADIMRDHGYEVKIASTGTQGLAMFREAGRKIALVVTDVSMPGMDGADFARTMLEIAPQTKIIFSTAAVVDKRVEKKLKEVTQMGGIVTLVKPFTSSVLLKTVADVMAAKPPRRR